MAAAADSKSALGNKVSVRVRPSAMITLLSLLKDFDLFCFDFDGLLVDTEPLHYQAYKEMFKSHGCAFDIDFQQYTQYAHHASGTALAQYAQAHFPFLKPTWHDLRLEKSLIYSALLTSTPTPLMPGIQELILALKAAGKEMTVVTNSYRPDVEKIIALQPFLQTIPRWITRDDYQKPKPDPAGYLYALSLYPDISKERTVGFEDTLKGVTALSKAEIYPILICDADHPQRLDYQNIPDQISHFPSVLEIISGSCV